MILDIPAFIDFSAQIQIPTKDIGLVRFDRLYGTQRWFLHELARGLEDGIHDFVILKGRQLGMTTLMDSFRLFFPQTIAGTQGMFVSNSDENRDHRRDISLEMLYSLPKAYRYPVRINNRYLLAWPPPNSSRLMFDAAGARAQSDLGRSRGVNFLDADEVGLWPSEQDVEALRASLSERNPRRLYLWNGTAKGFNMFYYMWEGARTATTQRAIFVPWWRHDDYCVGQSQETIWEAYAGPVTEDERLWIRAVLNEYEYEIEPEQLVWYRWVLAEKFYGNETMRAQEFPCLPEDAFQSFGDKFISPLEIQRLRLALKSPDLPPPRGYEYTAAAHLDESRLEPVAPGKAPLLIWEEPDEWGVYIISGHPWGSSSPSATQWVAQVYRAWPDRLVQCAEYTSDEGTTYAFAWLLIYLAGAYKRRAEPYIVNEASGAGYTVRKKLELLQTIGFGLSPSAKKAGMQDFLGNYRHYYWRRPDKLRWRAGILDAQTTHDTRPYILHSLADAVIQGHITIRSPLLINSLASLRRGESGNNDEIGGGSGASDAHAICAANAVLCWQDEAMYDLVNTVAPKELPRGAPESVGEALVGGFMRRLVETGRTR